MCNDFKEKGPDMGVRGARHFSEPEVNYNLIWMYYLKTNWFHNRTYAFMIQSNID